MMDRSHFERFDPSDIGLHSHQKQTSNRARNVGKKSQKNLNSLHAGLEAAWTDLDANTMRNFCSQFTKRLEAVVKAN